MSNVRYVTKTEYDWWMNKRQESERLRRELLA